LRFVTVVWRHGDRAPSDGTFPTDTGNGELTWPQGFGELSQAGMRQHQHLGEFLRQRYVDDYGFLSGNYSTKEIYIRSSSFNRTLMSAMSNLVGMYPTPNGMDMLDDIPLWQPIPVHSQPREKDPMLWMSCPCPTVDDIYYNQVMQSDQVKQIEQENQDFLNFLLKNTGMPHMTLDDVWDVWDPLNCERIYNDTHTWPTWVTEEVFDQLTPLMHLSTTFYYHDTRIQRFRGSLLYNDIATRFDQKANRAAEIQPPELKYYVYSAHDTTMTALFENLGAYNGHLPDYATAIMFELHEKTKGAYTVETWYANETSGAAPPYRVVVKGCDDQVSGVCDLATFVKLAGSNVPTDWYAECGDTTNVLPCDNNEGVKIAAIVLAVTTGVFLLSFVMTLILYCRLSKRSKVGQLPY